ncbi:MAG: ATP-binding protein, partial [Deltaproteobacteria bacterium]|nr:ATP-binding protein [Deltaproteobacteria bacterium]
RRSEDSHLQGYDELLEIYVPIKEGRDTVGVIAAYKSSATFFDNLKRGKTLIWQMSAAGGLIFYLSFFGFFFRAYKEQKSMTEGIEKLNEELSAMNAVALTVSQSLNLELILKNALMKVIELLGARAGIIFLVSKENKELRYSVYEGMSDSIAEKIIAAGEKERINVIAGGYTEPMSFSFYGEDQASAGACVRIPIVSRNEVIGLIELIYPDNKRYFPQDEKDLLSSIGHQIGVAVEKAQLYKEVKEFGKDLEKMVEERTLELKRSRDEIQAIFDAVTDIIIVRDLDHLVIMANRAALKVFKLSQERIINEKCHQLFKGIHDPCRECVAHETALTHKSASIEIKNSLNEEIFHISTFPMLDDDGNVRGFIEYAKVVTEQKKMEEQVIQMEKLSTLGELLGEIAHQINNPLVGVVNYAQLALKQLGKENPVREELEIIEKAGLTCKATIKKLLEFTRPSAFEWKVVDCNELIDDSLLLIEQQMGLSEIELIKNYTENLPPVKVDSTLMIQVFFNIINNAREAMNKEGTLAIKTLLNENGLVKITFKDTGPGIEQENLPHIFSPFFTTKRDKGGTGLGLSVVSNIVVRHNGKIWASSKAGDGTTFSITLPAAE